MAQAPPMFRWFAFVPMVWLSLPLNGSDNQ